MNKVEIQKTLRAELNPYGKTDVNSFKDVIERDRERYESRKEVMNMIDERHKTFLSCITDAPLDFMHLENVLAKFNANKKDKNVKKKLESLQKEMCAELMKWIESNNKAEFIRLTAATPAGIIAELSSQYPNNKHLSLFNNFASYLIDYSKSRSNIYSKSNKHGSVSHRLITDNFPKFVQNKNAYMKLVESLPNLMSDVLDVYPQFADFISAFASTDRYMMFASQDGIMRYNIIAGKINEIINMHVQENPDDKKAFKKLRMKPLYKQILFDAESILQKFQKIHDENELRDVMRTLWEDTLEFGKAIKELEELLRNIDAYDKTGIFIKKKGLPGLSKYIYDDHLTVSKQLKEKYGKNVMKTHDSFQLSEIAENDVSINNFFSNLGKHQSLALIAYARINSSDNLLSDKSISDIHEFMENLNDFCRISNTIAVTDSPDADTQFYNRFEEYADKMSAVKRAFNVIKSFVCQRPKDLEVKFPLTFDYPSFMGGWDYDKIARNIYGAAMFVKDNRIYVGVMNKDARLKFDDIRPAKLGEDTFNMVVYKQFGNPDKQLPHLFKPDAPEEISKMMDDKTAGRPYDMFRLIDYYKACLEERYGNLYDLKFSETSEYKTFDDFSREVMQCTYHISFTEVPTSQINEWIESRKMYMFVISTKDYAPGAYGSKELFTIFLESLFSKDNLQHNVIRLNGGARIMMRPNVLDKPFTHKKGSVLLCKRDVQGNPIPPDVYDLLSRYLNGRTGSDEKKLAEKTMEEYKDVISFKKAKYEIVKDRRYTRDMFTISLPITINPGCKVSYSEFNREIRRRFMESENAHIIGIDRGERNMLYITIIDKNGKTVLQKSLNMMDGYDFHMKLEQLENQRRDNQRNWKASGNIKHLKEGYSGKAVYEIYRLMLEYNAIIVLEALNGKFKTYRNAAFGAAVYTNFQNALISKLSYLVLKECQPLEKGGVLNGYQFAYPVKEIGENVNQIGAVFFVPAGYTSKVDPITGFTSLIDFSDYESSDKKAAKFTNSFDSIRINERGLLETKFKHDKFKTHIKNTGCEYTCIADGQRILTHKNQETGGWEYIDVDVRTEMNNMLEKYGISTSPGTDIKDEITKLRKNNPSIDKDFLRVMKTVMHMRNSNPHTGEDYIISPAVDKHGMTFDSRDIGNDAAGRPTNGDSNGARNIALKALIMLNNEQTNGEFKSIKNTEWFNEIPKFSN